MAHGVRRGVHRERELERRILETHLKAALAGEHEKELRELEACYLARVGQLGQGHMAAQSDEQVWRRYRDQRLLDSQMESGLAWVRG